MTEEHAYGKTAHFRERLRRAGVPLREQKHMQTAHYTKKKVFGAIKRAKELHVDRNRRYPMYLATAVYQLLDKMAEMLPENA